MSEQHLRDLENNLARCGWRIVSVLPGDDYRIAGSWELQRSTRQPYVVIDFEGLDKDGNKCLPIEEAYGCQLRGRPDIGLYFGKRRAKWAKELAAFVNVLES